MILKFTKRLPELVFLSWIILFAQLFLSGDYLTYLRPDFSFLIIIGFILSILVFFGGVLQKRKYEEPIRLMTNSLVIIIPIIYYFISSNASLDSYAFTKKRTDENIDPSDKSIKWKPKTVKNKDELTLVEVSQLASPFWDFNGALVETQGQIFREEKQPFLALYRFVVSCCAADARPVAIYLPNSELTKHLQNDQWVKVRGRFKENIFENKKIRIIEPDSITPIKAPPQYKRYLYN